MVLFDRGGMVSVLVALTSLLVREDPPFPGLSKVYGLRTPEDLGQWPWPPGP